MAAARHAGRVGADAELLPSASAETQTSAASSAGAISAITPANQPGSSRPPSAIGPAALIDRGHDARTAR